MKRPAFQFYPADWRKDAAVQSCSIAARGLWHEMLCIMHECEPYGHLTVNGTPMTTAQLARLVGISPRETSKLLAELAQCSVFSKTEDGTIYSRRMVRDEAVRRARAEGGESGGKYGIAGAEHGKKGGRPKKGNGGLKTPLPDEEKGRSETPLADAEKPAPSSSPSSSSSESLPPPSESVAARASPAEPLAAVERGGPEDRIVARFCELRRELWPNESRLPSPSQTLRTQAGQFLAAGGSEALILEMLERGIRKRAADGMSVPNSLSAFRDSISDAITRQRNAENPDIPAYLDRRDPLARAKSWDETRWRYACELAQREGWSDDFGPPPGDPNCLAPAHLLAEFNLDERKRA